MKLFIAIPTYDGKTVVELNHSLTNTLGILLGMGIEATVTYHAKDAYIHRGRNTLARKFLASDATDLLMIDADEGWNPEQAVRMILRPYEFVGGAYTFKSDDEPGYPVTINTDANGRPLVDPATGCISATMLPTGFYRLKRSVFEKLIPTSDWYWDKGEQTYNFFETPVVNHEWIGEDVMFCRKWLSILGQIWLDPNIDFDHVGSKSFKGNYHHFLMRQVGGSEFNGVNITKAISVPGWMSVEELVWLAGQATNHRRIVEIGSWLGRSTRALADNTAGRVYAVDTWNGSEEHKELLKDVDPDALYNAFLKNVSDLRNVSPIRKSSQDAASDCMGDIDMVFIDGSHDYENVKADILAWKPKAKKLICGHDFNWDGVKQAVSELLPNYKTVEGTTLWYCEDMR